MGDQYVTWNLNDIIVGEELPGSVFLYIDFRFITFRAGGDIIDKTTFDRLEFKKVKNLFVKEEDRQKFQAWLQKKVKEEENTPPLEPVNKLFAKVRADAHRKLLDIFQADHPDKLVLQTMVSSKKLVGEVMKFPFAAKSLAQLQNYSQGTVGHSVNVSILSTYLAMQMGYSHALILQHVSMGALLHDIGKTKIRILDDDNEEVITVKMKEHPTIGMRMLESQPKIPNEVKMIVMQHHECPDGSGYPKKLRSSQIYDLARIVSIANVFDELVGNGKGSLVDRQRAAINKIDQELYKKFDPVKLEKALKILRLGV